MPLQVVKCHQVKLKYHHLLLSLLDAAHTMVQFPMIQVTAAKHKCHQLTPFIPNPDSLQSLLQQPRCFPQTSTPL